MVAIQVHYDWVSVNMDVVAHYPILNEASMVESTAITAYFLITVCTLVY